MSPVPLPATRGRAMQLPGGLVLWNLNTRASDGCEMNSSASLRLPVDTHCALPQSGGIGTPFAAHSLM